MVHYAHKPAILALLGAIGILYVILHSTYTRPIALTIATYNGTAAVFENNATSAFESIKIENWKVFELSPNKGEADSETILLSLASTYKNPSDKHASFRIFVDIGANVGRTSQKIISFVTDNTCRVDEATNFELGNIKRHQNCENDKQELILAFEPAEANFDVLTKKSLLKKWDGASWVGIQAAVGDTDENATFYTSGIAGDEQSSLDAEAASIDDAPRTYNARKISLDYLFQNGYEISGLITPNATRSAFFDEIIPNKTNTNAVDRWDIFLLKIDTEGYDYYVIRGASQLLATRRVKFLVFEYNSKWFSQGRNTTLQSVVHDLLEVNYTCFWILNTDLVPMSGKMWIESYETASWSNVMCGAIGDLDVKRVVNGFNVNIIVEWKLLGF